MNEIRFQCRCGSTFRLFGSLVSHWKSTHQVIAGESLTVKDQSVIDEARVYARRIENQYQKKRRAAKAQREISRASRTVDRMFDADPSLDFSQDDEATLRKYREFARE